MSQGGVFMSTPSVAVHDEVFVRPKQVFLVFINWRDVLEAFKRSPGNPVVTVKFDNQAGRAAGADLSGRRVRVVRALCGWATFRLKQTRAGS